MDPANFTTESAGQLIKTPRGFWSFIPAPLPPKLDWDMDLAIELSNADASLSELSGLGRYLPNPDLLIAPYVNREAVSSSRIEGTQADLAELLLDKLAPGRTSEHSDVHEVQNYVAAMRVGMEKLQTMPLAGPLIRDLHSLLMHNVRGNRFTPGEYRKTQNWIGPPMSNVNNAIYVPPPPDEMLVCLARLENFLEQRSTMPDLVQCALMHEHFEAIHPFLDGNGRIGRLLITLFLLDRGRLTRPLLYLSSYIERHRRDYYELLMRIRTHGDWHHWLLYFFTAVRDTAREAIAQANSILTLRETLRQQLPGKHTAQALIDELFINPYVDVRRASELLKVSDTSADKTIKTLVAAGILEETTRRKWGRIWLAKAILAAMQESPDIA